MYIRYAERKGWRVETFPNYAAQFPSMYVAAKLMWNHHADVDALRLDAPGSRGRVVARQLAAQRMKAPR
mgnify:CR=1 FL=1